MIKPADPLWIKAKADNEANAKATAVVSEIIDENNFKYIQGGLIPGDYTIGEKYLLSITTAGAVFIQSDPEIWTAGQYRQMIGTGTTDGLLVEIDEGTIVLTQTPDKDWITLICRDVVAGTADSIPLNMKAYVGYTIDSLTLQTDNGTLTVTVKINGIAITGLSGISATTTITETAATALKTVAVGDLVTIEWSTAYTGTPTKIYAELNMTR